MKHQFNEKEDMTTQEEFAALRQWHDDAIARGRVWSHARVNEGLCRLTSVTRYASDRLGGCLGECRTDLSEVFGCFDAELLERADTARAEHQRVLLDVRRSKAGHRYIAGLKALDTSRNPTPCLRCDTMAFRAEPTPELPDRFVCPSCHAIWFVEPIPRQFLP